MMLSCVSCGEYYDTTMREASRRGRLCPTCYALDYDDVRSGRCDGCGATWSAAHTVYRCPKCGHSLRPAPEGGEE